MAAPLTEYPDRDHWVTLPAHGYAPRELWYPLSMSTMSWDDGFHQLLLHDHLRMDKYERAIMAAVRDLIDKKPLDRNPIRVLDIGTGTGVFSYFAVQAVSSLLGVTDPETLPIRVYAIDCHRPIIETARTLLGRAELLATKEYPKRPVFVCEANAYQFIDTLKQRLDDVHGFDPTLSRDLEERDDLKCFDLLVTETLGGLGDNEDITRLLRTLIPTCLSENGIVVPSRLRQLVSPVGLRKSVHNTRIGTSPHRAVMALADSSSARIPPIPCKMLNENYEPPQPMDAFDSVYDTIFLNKDCLSSELCTREWDFRPAANSVVDQLADEYVSSVDFELDGVQDANRFFSGFKGFFEATLYEDEAGENAIILCTGGDDIQNNETSDCWKHTYMPIRQQARIERGYHVTLRLSRRLVRGSENDQIEYEWSGRVLDRDRKEIGTFRQGCTFDVPSASPVSAGSATAHSRTHGNGHEKGASSASVPPSSSHLPAETFEPMAEPCRVPERGDVTVPEVEQDESSLPAILVLILRVMEIFLGIGFAMVLSTLFGFAASGVHILQDTSVSGGHPVRVEPYQLPDRVLMGAIIVTMARLIHSFAVLVQDKSFKGISAESKYGGWVRALLQLAVQFVLVATSVVMVTMMTPTVTLQQVMSPPFGALADHPAFAIRLLPLWGILMMPILLFYDLPAWRVARKAAAVKAKQGELVNPRQRTIMRALKVWVVMDTICFASIFVWVVIPLVSPWEGRGPLNEELVEWVVASVLVVAFFVDYGFNRFFYVKALA